MYRLTEGENQLRTDIGLYIWEPYLLNFMHDGIAHGLYEEVLPEQEYTYKGSKSQSPDVLVRNGEDILFMLIDLTQQTTISCNRPLYGTTTVR